MKYELDPELNHVVKIKQGHLNKILLKFADIYMKNVYRELDKIDGIHYDRIRINDSFYIYVIIPNDINGNTPCNINFHGGAFVYRGWDNHFKQAAIYARSTNSIVVYVDYRLAYNTEYNTTLNDCIEATKWVYNNANYYGIDINKISISGDSAGGFLALEVNDYIIKNNLFKPNGLMLIYPVVDPKMRTDSMAKYTDTPVWNSIANKDMWNIYLKGNIIESYLDKDISYINSCYIETCEFDCLHDEGILLYERLKDINYIVLNETFKTVHGYDTKLGPTVVNESVDKRINYLLKINE